MDQENIRGLDVCGAGPANDVAVPDENKGDVAAQPPAAVVPFNSDGPQEIQPKLEIPWAPL